MRALGFAFQKGRMRVVALDESGGAISVFQSKAVTIDPQLPLPDLMDRYATQIRILIDEYAPDQIAAKQIWESKNVAAANCQVAPIGILAYVCHERSIPLSTFTPQALRQPKPFGLAVGTNPVDGVDAQFGQHPPYWDDMQKAAVLSAWRALLDSK